MTDTCEPSATIAWLRREPLLEVGEQLEDRLPGRGGEERAGDRQVISREGRTVGSSAEQKLSQGPEFESHAATHRWVTQGK